MKKVYKEDNDFVFHLRININDFTEFAHVRQFKSFRVKIYTNDVDEYAEAYYLARGAGIYHNIVVQNDEDFVIVNAQDLSKLENGTMKIHIEFTCGSPYFSDYQYNETYDIETDYYLTDAVYNQSNCKHCCKLIND
jgi:hypothetical protein